MAPMEVMTRSAREARHRSSPRRWAIVSFFSVCLHTFCASATTLQAPSGATASIPSGLYRFSDYPQDLGTGTLALNFGVLSRLTLLSDEGRETLIGLESGVMTMGLATEKDRQLAIVAELGVGVPLGQRQSTDASVTQQHAFEKTRTRDRLPEARSNADMADRWIAAANPRASSTNANDNGDSRRVLSPSTRACQQRPHPAPARRLPWS